MKKFKNLFILCVCFWIFPNSAPVRAESAAFSVISGVPPYAYLAKRIGGEHLQVHVLIDQGQDPHTFEPSPKKLMLLGLGRIFFSAGLEIEQRIITKIRRNFSDLQVVDLSQDFKFGSRKTESDPHIWLSPSRVQIQAGTMAEALSAVNPEDRQVYQNNLAGFISDLVKIRERIQKQLTPFRGRQFFVFHPAFGHFGEDFGLVQQAVESSGKRPSPKDIAALISRAKRERVKIIFAQPQFDLASAETIASAIDGVVVTLDPLAKNLLSNFEEIAEKLERAFK